MSIIYLNILGTQNEKKGTGKWQVNKHKVYKETGQLLQTIKRKYVKTLINSSRDNGSNYNIKYINEGDTQLQRWRDWSKFPNGISWSFPIVYQN